MDKSRVCRFLNNEIESSFSSKSKSHACYQKMLVKYGIPYRVTAGMLHKNIAIDQVEDQLLFCMVDAFSEKRIHLYFSKEEVGLFSNYRFPEETLGDKISFDVVEISPKIWNGKIDASYLMKLRDNYVIYKSEVDLLENEKDFTYSSLEKKFDNGEYNPKLISFKIPKDVKWKYSKDEYRLVLFNNDNLHIFITGGYIDYVKISNLCNAGKEMNFSVLMNIEAE